MKQVTIVWMNNTNATIITATPIEVLTTVAVASELPKFSPSMQTPELRKQKKEAQFDYFKNLTHHLKEAKEIVLFGEDNTKEEFLDYLNDQMSILFSKVVGVESSQDMPEEKIIARGRKYI